MLNILTWCAEERLISIQRSVILSIALIGSRICPLERGGAVHIYVLLFCNSLFYLLIRVFEHLPVAPLVLVIKVHFNRTAPAPANCCAITHAEDEGKELREMSFSSPTPHLHIYWLFVSLDKLPTLSEHFSVIQVSLYIGPSHFHCRISHL